MIDVAVNIAGIIMYCDESIQAVNLGNGYLIEKAYLDDLPFKDKVTDGRGVLNIAYMGSRLRDDNGTYFMCIRKNDVYQIEGPRFTAECKVITDRDCMSDAELEAYKESEMAYLYNAFSLLRLFKAGNIGLKDVFLEHSFTVMGFINNKMNHHSSSESRNIVDTRRYALSADEIHECNQFLADYHGRPFELMKPSIDEFIWGLEQIDTPTGFEQFTTALEMTLLATNQRGKKQALANRVAILLGSDPADIQSLHGKMLNFYRYRSESLHEGNGSNITDAELIEMEDIVRRVLCKLLTRCKSELSVDNTKTWEIIKSELITELTSLVTAAKAAGTLPA